MKQLLYISILLISAGMAPAQAQQLLAVYFGLDKYAVTTDAKANLDSFLSFNKSDGSIKLFGYCDIKAGFDYNDRLSVKRVRSVKNYLLSKGFNAANITAENGYGKRRLLNNNLTAADRKLNRRVEIVLNELPMPTAIINTQPPPGKTLTEQLIDSQSTKGKNIVLKNLNFYGGTHRVLPESISVLQELLEVMKKNPMLEISVEGHVCCTEGPGDGLDLETNTNNLSENRAREIYNYLQKNGIAPSRLRYKGFGHRFPLSMGVEKTEEERIANRRVEIQILKR